MRLLRFLFLIQLVFSFPAHAEQRPCNSSFRKIAAKALFAVAMPTFIAMLGQAATMRNLQHVVISQFSQHRHLGMGIYYDPENIKAIFSPEERALLNEPEVHRKEVITLLSKKLYGGYDKSRDYDANGGPKYLFSNDYPTGVLASSFLDPGNRERGVCRHKAVVLEAMLNDLGIEAKSFALETKEGGLHRVVFLPKDELIADPTNNEISNFRTYRWERASRYLDEAIEKLANGPH